MSSDPHAPTPAGPDPDEPTEVSAGAPTAGDEAAAPTVEEPAGGAEPDVGSDWLAPDAPATLVPDPAAETPPESFGVATPQPDPVVATPPAFTPLGTPEPAAPSPLGAAQAFLDKPEGRVAAAFAGGVVFSFLLRKLGR